MKKNEKLLYLILADMNVETVLCPKANEYAVQ